jgi:hypothetical protein
VLCWKPEIFTLALSLTAHRNGYRVHVDANMLLAERMAAAGLKQQELADALNERIEGFTGKVGTVTDRHVRNWLTGRTRSPHARQRRALEEEFGCPAEELASIRQRDSVADWSDGSPGMSPDGSGWAVA